MNKDNRLIEEIEEVKAQTEKLFNKLLKDVERQKKIMLRADKRQQREYDELQKKLEEVEKLQEAQKNLLESFIKLIASAIDTKSPYTGGHCERVPELAIELAKKVSEDESIDYELKNEKELEYASWLHDCGKIVTPEYVMDKATKLETIYNRIHEIRMRFEVLYRDVKIKALEKILSGEDKEEVEKWQKEEFDRLTKEWEFIARVNVGGEFLSDEDIEKLYNIGSQEWIRYFDDTIGLSWAEKNRKEITNTPAVEKLLANKKEHLIPREKELAEMYKRHKFTVKIPELENNLGEIYNLSIKRGTLNNEEFFRIQEHIMMTIDMLESLPFPENLKNVPLIAGTHHEKLDGSGYPRGLKDDEIPIEGKMLAIADVFEALTSHDRPYKTPKKLSEAIKILFFMAKDRHIDKDLLKIFLKSGLYLEYAKSHLLPEQIDEVNINDILNKLDKI